MTEFRYIITGFQPFGDHDYNPSWDAACALAETLGVDAHLLPVTFTTAAQYAHAHLVAARPLSLVFIHLGLGEARSEVCFERRAVNERDHRPDNLERTLPVRLPKRRALIKDARPERFCRLDLNALLQTYTDNRTEELPPAKISDDCGRYVCNALYYHSLQACERAKSEGQTASHALFIHLPLLEPPHATALGSALGRSIAAISSTDRQ